MKKLEQKLNNLLEKIKQEKLDKDEISLINWCQFFYNVGRINILQATAQLIVIAKLKGFTDGEIEDLLK